MRILARPRRLSHGGGAKLLIWDVGGHDPEWHQGRGRSIAAPCTICGAIINDEPHQPQGLQYAGKEVDFPIEDE